MYARVLKRLFDLTFAAATITLLSPVFLFVALAIYLDDGAPIFFRQARIGQGGRPFTIFKFRSMSRNTPDIPSIAARGSVRVTRVGRLIRLINVDEFPQLLNILQGTMSVVGPRPCLPRQEELLARRVRSGVVNLKPGLTGLAQINSFDGMSERAVASWDKSYSRKVCFLSDVKIVLLTFRYCMQRPPVY